MWVADMDFGTAPAVVGAIEKRLQKGAFGYNTVPDSFRESVIRWWQRRHQFTMEKEWILYCTGVVPSISSIVRKMTEIGDDIVVLSPVYNIFYNSILNNGRKVLASELRYEAGAYAIDFADLTHIGHAYIPFASVSFEIAERTITCVAPTKAFNLAGLQTAAIVIPNTEIRKIEGRGINTDEVAEPNTFAIQAACSRSPCGRG